MTNPYNWQDACSLSYLSICLIDGQSACEVFIFSVAQVAGHYYSGFWRQRAIDARVGTMVAQMPSSHNRLPALRG